MRFTWWKMHFRWVDFKLIKLHWHTICIRVSSTDHCMWYCLGLSIVRCYDHLCEECVYSILLHFRIVWTSLFSTLPISCLSLFLHLSFLRSIVVFSSGIFLWACVWDTSNACDLAVHRERRRKQFFKSVQFVILQKKHVNVLTHSTCFMLREKTKW